MQNLKTDFGALGDGATDDTLAVQDALDNSEGLLAVPAGVYRIDGTLHARKAVKIIGPGLTSVGASPARAEFKSLSDGNDILHVEHDNVVIDGLHFGGVGGRQAPGKGSAIVVGPVSRTVQDGAITSGSTTFQSQSANFTANDVGAKVRIAGAVNGSSTPAIVSVTNATTVQLSFAADNTVSGAGTTIAHVVENVVLRNVSTASQFIGVHFINTSNFRIDGCEIHAWYGAMVENRVAPDKGDSYITDSQFSGPPTTGSRGIFWRSSGALKIQNSKFLHSHDGIHIEWKHGKSGGPIIRGCSFENILRYFVYGHGDGVTELHGMGLYGNWFNGAQGAIYFANNLALTKLAVVANQITSGTGVRIGSAVNGAFIDGNQFSCATPISNSGANTLIGTNQYL